MSKLTLLAAAEQAFNALTAIGQRGVQLRSEEHRAIIDLNAAIGAERSVIIELLQPGKSPGHEPAAQKPSPEQATAKPQATIPAVPEAQQPEAAPSLKVDVKYKITRKHSYGAPFNMTAEHIGVSREQVRGLIFAGVLRACDISKQKRRALRINRDDIDRLVDEMRADLSPSQAPLDSSWCLPYKQLRPKSLGAAGELLMQPGNDSDGDDNGETNGETSSDSDQSAASVDQQGLPDYTARSLQLLQHANGRA
jgi:hypothetical protein